MHIHGGAFRIGQSGSDRSLCGGAGGAVRGDGDLPRLSAGTRTSVPRWPARLSGGTGRGWRRHSPQSASSLPEIRRVAGWRPRWRRSRPCRLAGLALLSPWLDLTVSRPSYAANAATDPLFSAAAASEAAAQYFQGISPRRSAGQPAAGAGNSACRRPSSMSAAAKCCWMMRLAFDARLRAEGVASQLSLIDGMDHVAVTRDLALPGAASAFDRAGWLYRYLCWRSAGAYSTTRTTVSDLAGSVSTSSPSTALAV